MADQTVLHGEKIKKPDNPSKKGHSFKNWTYQGEEWSFIGYVVTENMTLDANWTLNRYTLDINHDNYSAGDVYGAGIYDYGSHITVRAEPKRGYSFLGWYDTNHNLLSNNKD